MTFNESLSQTFSLVAKLMELHDGNPFKVKSYASAAFKIDKMPQELDRLSEEELAKLDGIGKGLSSKIEEYKATGSLEELNELLQSTPSGVIEILQIKGLGPKKVRTIWKDLNILSPGELLYACKENRLAQAKGFGLKTQEEVIKAIEFRQRSSGHFHYATIEHAGEELEAQLRKNGETLKLARTGRYGRFLETLEFLEWQIATHSILQWIHNLELALPVSGELNGNTWKGKLGDLPLIFHFSTPETFIFDLLQTGSSEEFRKALDLHPGNFEDEAAAFRSKGYAYVLPEQRETASILEKAKSGPLQEPVKLQDLKGILHNHSTWSDGIHSLEEMALYCKELGYEYLGICDHSKTAFYANGLSAERVLQQHAEIEALNQKLAPFTIFKGIESDILNDGSLDYEPEILQKFDFLVASVHSNLKMSQEKAHERLTKAIENPYTTILGHPTGRLLLSREGYPIDHHYIIDACAANGVVIEINANPYRLDMDWRHIDYALNKGVKLSINPDAHEKQGFLDMHYGVLVARKGGLTAGMTFNALSRDEISAYFASRKA